MYPRTEKRGSLYVVSTPIGNLNDITIRALEILKQVDTIAAESVRRTRAFCQHYGIKTKVIRFNEHNQKAKGPELINKINQGANVALVTDAGTPGISDPGVFLVKMAHDEGIRVCPVPGPSAVTAALSVAGFRSDRFVFLGFVPPKQKARQRVLKKWIFEGETVVMFEAPHRIKETLLDIADILGDQDLVMVREMTKLYEEVQKAPALNILQSMEEGQAKGEITLVLPGIAQKEKNWLDKGLSEEIKKMLVDNKMGVRDIAEYISQKDGIPYRDVYKKVLLLKRTMDQ